jgi:hypothetical protein
MCQALKTFLRLKVDLHTLLPTALEETDWLASCLDQFASVEMALVHTEKKLGGLIA